MLEDPLCPESFEGNYLHRRISGRRDSKKTQNGVVPGWRNAFLGGYSTPGVDADPIPQQGAQGARSGPKQYRALANRVHL